MLINILVENNMLTINDYTDDFEPCQLLTKHSSLLENIHSMMDKKVGISPLKFTHIPTAGT